MTLPLPLTLAIPKNAPMGLLGGFWGRLWLGSVHTRARMGAGAFNLSREAGSASPSLSQIVPRKKIPLPLKRP